MPRIARVACLLAGIFAWASTAHATALTVGGGWNPVEWGCGIGQVGHGEQCGARPDTPADGFYSFQLLTPGALTFTDMFTAGDQFTLKINGSGYDSSPVSAVDFGYEQPECVGNFAQAGCPYGFNVFAFDNARFNTLATLFQGPGKSSTLQVALGPGTYSVEFWLTAMAPNTSTAAPDDVQDSGLAAVRVDAVPEPASMLPLGTGSQGCSALAGGQRNSIASTPDLTAGRLSR